MIIGFGNNVASALASDITATQTSFAVMPGSGSKFANLLTTDISNPDSPHDIYAKLTLTDSQQTVFEICHLLSVSQDTLTVLRGQEGTQAKGWSLNDVVANFATRGSEHHFVQIEQLQAGDYTAAKAGGTANALAIVLPSTFFNNSSTDWQLNTPLVITPTVTNTGAATLQVTISDKVVGTYPLVKGNNTALQAGDIVDKSPFVTVFNSEQERFIILNPTTEIGLVRTVNSIGPDASGNVAIPMYGLGLGPVAKSDAYSNIAQFYRVNNVSANKPPAVTGNVSAGVVCLPMDAAPSAGYFSVVGGSVAAYAGFSGAEAGGITWARIYTDKYKPTAQDTGALPLTGGTCTGQIIAPNFASTPDATPVGSGTYSEQLGNQAPFFQPNWQWPVTSGGVFVPIAKGTSTRKDKGWPTAISYGYLMPGEDMHAHPVIHALGDSGMENIWEFDTQTGGLRSGKAGEFATQNWVNSRCPFPVGYFMLMGNGSDPNVIYPGTAWQDMTAAYDGRVLSLGYDALGTGGSNSVTLGVEHMPPHSHNLKAYHSNTSLDGGWSNRYSVDPTEGSEANDVITSTGGGQSFNVTNAYVHVRGWMRTS
jgi:hypothetical protein